MPEQVEKVIELSKSKILLLISASLAFVALGLLFVSLDTAYIESQRRYNSPILVHSIGWASIVFFGLCGVIGVKKLFDKAPGLIFSSTGVAYSSSGVSAGIIPWSEIAGFKIYVVNKQKMLIVLLNNPDKYIETGSAFRRILNRTNYKMCGSPVAITSSALKINFDELLEISNEYFSKYGKPV